MKKIMFATSLGIGIGASLTAYLMNNKTLKHKAKKMLNNAIKETNEMLETEI